MTENFEKKLGFGVEVNKALGRTQSSDLGLV